MKDNLEHRFGIKKRPLIVEVTLSIFVGMAYFALIFGIPFETKTWDINFDLMPIVHILSAFVAIYALINSLVLVFFRPVKVILDATGICSVTLLGHKSCIEFSEIAKVSIRSRISRMVFSNFAILTNRDKTKKVYIPAFLKNKTTFNELIKEKTNNKKEFKLLLK